MQNSRLQEGVLGKGVANSTYKCGDKSTVKSDDLRLKERIKDNEMCELLAIGLTFGN